MFHQNNPGMFTQISYHVSWPGTDPFYSYNTADSEARRSFYGVNSVPNFQIDGVNTTSWQSTITANAATTSPLGLSIAGTYDYQTGNGSVIVAMSPEAGVNGDYTLHVVLVQDGLYYMGSNGYPDHEHVMRDMFPSSGGTVVSLEAGIDFTETVNFQVPLDLPVNDCRLVVFVQASDREVLNAATDYIPDLQPLNIPNLSALSSHITIIDGDEDGKLNPGESAEFSVTINNDCEFVSAFDVTGYLSSPSPYVTITDSVGFFDMIIACDIVTNFADKFAFSVAEDAPPVHDIPFYLRMEANQSTEIPYEVILPLTVSMDLFQANYPIPVSQSILSGNAVVDLNGDGVSEIIVGGSDSLLHVFTMDGTELAGFPYATDNWIVGSPAVGDIDNDGDLEIVITSRDRHIHVIQHDGSGVALVEAASYLLSTPVLEDLDNDGDLEIIATGFGYDLIASHHDGAPVDNYPVIVHDGRMSTGAAVADLNGDGSKDIVVGTWSDSVFAYAQTGELLDGFPVDLVSNVAAPPVIADVDGDGTLEILVGQDGGYFYALGHDGSVLWTERMSSASIRTSAAVSDFDGDGDLEIVYSTLAGGVNMLDHEGNVLEGWPQIMAGACFSSPVTADLDGDGQPEIIVGSSSAELYVYNFDGSLYNHFPLALAGPVQGTPTVTDMTADGTMELVVGTDNDITAINLKMQADVGPSWSTARGNLQRTGFFDPLLMSIKNPVVPNILQLKQNYPNPFNPSTTIAFDIPTQGMVTLVIYDLLGEEVTRLIHTEMAPGSYQYQWNGLDASSQMVETGMYFARIRAGGSEQILKMMMLK